MCPHNEYVIIKDHALLASIFADDRQLRHLPHRGEKGSIHLRSYQRTLKHTNLKKKKESEREKKKEKRSALDASRRNICTAVTTTSCEQRAEASNETNLLLVRFASQDRIIRITRKAPGPLPLPEDDADIGGSSLCTCLSFLPPFLFLLLLSLILFFSCVVLDCKLERSSRDVLIINHGHRSSSCWGFFLFFCCATVSWRFESAVSSFFSPFFLHFAL